jgi:tetratricopeptide (TPR) repeat protein
MSTEELEKILAPIVTDGTEDARRAAVKSISDLGPDAVPSIAKELAELRKNGGAGVVAVMKAVREKGGHAKDSDNFDLVDALFHAEKTDGPGFKTTLATVALARGLVHAGTTDAARALLPVAADHGGALRPEIARDVKTMGDRAVPALIEARRADTPEVRRFANGELEALGKRTPGDAVQTKSSAVLADVLRAYGQIHDTDAIPVVLSFVNTDHADVRIAAREALAAYGQDAVWKTREAYLNLTGKPAPDAWNAREVADQLFASYDRFRLQEAYALLDEGKSLEQAGKLDAAVADYDKVLARQPLIDRRTEMVSGYVAYAMQIEDKDPENARALLRRASRLDPTGPRAPQAEAEIAFLDGDELLKRGIQDREPFDRALKLDPGNAHARAALDGLETKTEARQDRARRWMGGAALLASSCLADGEEPSHGDLNGRVVKYHATQRSEAHESLNAR